MNGSAVVDFPALILRIELFNQDPVVQNFVGVRNGLDDLFDVLHGEGLLVDEIGSVIWMADMVGGNMVGHRIAPFVFFADVGDVLIVDVHDHGHIVPGGNILIDILGDEFCRKVAGAPPHSIDRGIQNQGAFGLDFPQNLRIGKSELHVVVPMESQMDFGVHVLVDQIEAVGNLVAVHASQSIYNIECIRLELVHLFHQLEQLDVAVKDCPHRLHKDAVALFHDNFGPIDRRFDFLFVEGQANPIDAVSIIGSEFGWMQLFLPDGDHGHVHGVPLLFWQHCFNIGGAVKEGTLLFLDHTG